MCHFRPGFDTILTKKTHFLSQMCICENTNFGGGGGGGGGKRLALVLSLKNENMIVPIPAYKFHGCIAGGWL